MNDEFHPSPYKEQQEEWGKVYDSPKTSYKVFWSWMAVAAIVITFVAVAL